MRILTAVFKLALRPFFLPALALIGALALAPCACATQVTWTLHNVTFSDGGTATGSFVYNADTNTYSSVNIVTTTGTSFSGATYTAPFSSTATLAPGANYLWANTGVSNFTGTPLLGLFFIGSLTDAGGTLGLAGATEGTCDSSNCNSTINARSGTTGSITSSQPATITNPTNGTISTGTIEYPLSATGGSGTYTWTLVSGSLPPGVALSTTVPSYFQSNQQAALLGVVTATGTYNFTLNLSDGVTNQSQAFTLTVTSLNIKDLTQLPDAFVGAAYSYSLTALNPANGGAGVSFSLLSGNNLPAGLTLSTAGVISGTPTTQQQSSFAITLTDGTNTITRGFGINVSAVQITTAGQLPNATDGAAYSQTLTATGGTGTNTFSLSGNSLPSGLSLTSSGTISGTVASFWAPGNQSFQVTVYNSGGNYQKWFSIDVLASPTPGLPEINVQRIDDLTVDDPASVVVGACCSGVAPFTWSATGLPTGMSVRFGSGVTSNNVAPGSVEIWGVPQTAGNYTVALTLTDNNGNSTTQNIPLHVSNLDELNFLPPGLLNSAYAAPVVVMGGAGPYSATLAAGALPDGVTIQSGPALSGTPLATGNFSPVFQFTDSSPTPNTLVRTNSLNVFNVSGGINIYEPSNLGTFRVGTNYSTGFYACCVSAYTWSVAAGSLPPGMALSSSGQFSGQFTTTGAYAFLVKAADQAGVAAAGYELLTVSVSPFSFTFVNTLPFANVGTAYSDTLTAMGGTAPLTWTLSANNYLPPGLTLSTAGVLSGTPTSAGQYAFNVTVTDANGNTASQGINIAIYPAGGGPPIVTTSASTFTLTTGTQQYPLGASGGNGTFTWSLTSGSLPPGLALRTDTPGNFFSNQQAGLIGVATTPGTYNFTLTCASGSQSVPQAFTVRITALNFQDLPNLPDDFASQPYSYTFTALNPANAGANVAFTLATNSSLPPGLTLTTSGVLSGTNGVPNNYSFQITLTDGVDTVTQNFNLLSSEVQIVSPAQLPNGTQGQAYNQTILSNGGMGPYTYQLAGGMLPPGLTMTNGGNISGIITSTAPTGPYSFGMVSLDSLGDSYVLQMSIDVLGTTPTLPGISIPHIDSLTIGDLASFTVSPCCGGAPPYTWTVTGLPAGMTDPPGDTPGSEKIVGAPSCGTVALPCTATTTVTPVVRSDGYTELAGDILVPAHATQSVPLTITPLGQLNGPPQATFDLDYFGLMRIGGGTPPYSATLIGGALPDGLLVVDEPGVGAAISGTPRENGNFTFLTRYQDSSTPPNFLVKTNIINVFNGNNGITITTPANLGTIPSGDSIFVMLNANGGSGSYNWGPGTTAIFTAGQVPPEWVQISSDGIMSGTPPGPGVYTFGVIAQDANNPSASPGARLFTLTVTPITVTGGSLPSGTAGTAYSQQLTATEPASTGSSYAQASTTNDAPTFTWALNADNYLPPGLTLSTAGVISGTPTSEGQYQFAATVTDSSGNTQNGNFTINVDPAGGLPLTIVTAATQTLPTGTTQYPLTAGGGTGTYTWSLTSGSLPPGLALRTDVPSFFDPTTQQAGLIGVATTPGTYNFTLTVASGSQSTPLAFTFKITALNIKDLSQLPDSFAGSSYSYAFTALNPANAGADVSFSVSNGSSLPAGLSLSTAGVLSGTPTASGQYSVGVTLTDGTDTIQQNFNLSVYTVAITTAGLLPNAAQNASYNQTLAASGGSSPYTFHIQNGQLPFGLSLSSSGAITGTLNAQPGAYTFAVNVADSANHSYVKQMALNVVGNPATLPGISIPTINDLTVGDSGSVFLGTCCGGTAPFTWSVTGLPTGMSARTGSGVTSSSVPPTFVELWGIPQTAGNYPVQVTATDANSVATSQTFNLRVSPLDQTPMLPGGTLNTAYSQTLRVLGGTGPYTASLATGKLPDGLTLVTDPSVTGTPIENGNFGPIIQFTDSASHTLLRGEGMYIGNGGGISINNNSNLGTVPSGHSYSLQLNACCVAAYAFSLSSGALPTGIALSSSGLLSGTPSAPGTFTFLVEAADQASVANPGFEQFTLVVTPITVTTGPLPYGTVGASYSQTFAATGGSGTLTWTLTAGNYLPPGLTLTTAGALTGTPTSEGQYNFNVTVTDSSSNTANQGYNVTIYASGGGPPPNITTGPNITLSTGVQQFALNASGGNGTFNWSLVSGSLPPALALRTDVPSFFSSSQQAGLIGVAATPGTYNFTLQVSSAAQTASQAFSVKITALNIKDFNTLPDSFVSSAYSYTFTALNPANGGAGVAFSVSQGSSLPAGLTLSSSGALTGTPGAAGQYSFGVNLTDGVDTIRENFNLKVAAVQITTTAPLPNGAQSAAYNQTLAASGGSGTYTFSVTSGSLPAGLSMNSSGKISGTITASAGYYYFTVTVADTSSNSYAKNMAIGVIGSTPALPEISLGEVDDLTVGNSSSFSIGPCCGGTPPFTWSVSGLPTGMSARFGSGSTTSSVNPGSVEMWGVPQAVGNYTVQLTLTDANSISTVQSFPLHVSLLNQNPNLPGGTINTAYAQPLRILGGTGPYGAALVGGALPDGLSINNTTGQVAGTPLENGGFNPILNFTDSASPANTLRRTNGMNVGNGGGIGINNSASLGNVTLGSSYSNTLSACCVSAYAWSVVSGTLPTGLALSSSGVLSGTPTAAGSYAFLVKAADQAAVASPGFRQFTLTVTPLTITTSGLPVGNLTVAYSQTLAATGGTGGLNWSLNANNYLPPGLSLSSSGVISGTPTSEGQYFFNVTVTDAGNHTATRGFDVSVYALGGGPPITVTAAATTTQPMGVLQFALGASGGTGTYTWALTAGSLPTGVALRTDVPSTFSSSQQAGLIGIATTTGTYSFTLTVTSGSQSTPQAFSMKITALNLKDFSTLPQAYAGTPYSYTFTPLNPAASPSFTHGGLPSGLSLSTSGALTGTPSVAGNFHFTVTVNDGTDSVTRTFTLNISPIQITTATALPNATQNAAYSQTLAASGGTGGYSYTIESGTLPPGLNLTSSGTISGTVTLGSSSPGLYSFNVGVFDSSNNFDSQWMSIDVIGDPPLQPSILTFAVSGFIVGGPASASIRVCCGGTPPFTWNVTGLPTGVSFRYGAANTSSTVAPGDVEIWGVPQTAGDYTPQFTVTDSNGATATVNMPLHVAVIIQTPALPNGTLGTPYSAELRVIGGTGPYSATLLERNLPDGLTLNPATMTVSGTPLENGNFSLVYRFNDSASPTSNYGYGGDSFTIANSSSTGISLNGPTDLVAQMGAPFTRDLADDECCANYATTSVVSGSLPPGISLDSYGVLSGTPTANGTYQFLVKGTDPSGTYAPGYQQFTVLVTPFANTSQTLPNGNVGTAYSQTLPVTGGTAPLNWALGLGYVLPPGLSLSSSGLVSGTPADSGQYVFTATVTDANSNTASLAFTINIYPAGGGPPFVNTTPATATYSTGTLQLPLSASGGTGTYVWSLVSGNLPPGLALRTDVPASFASNQQAGLIGVATTPGAYSFTLNVASGGMNVSQAFSLKITALNFKDARIPDLFVGVPYSYTLTAVGNAAPVTFQYVTGGNANLDPINLTPGGTISGTLGPGAAGVYNLVLSLTDGTDTVYCNCTLNVYAVNIAQALLPNGTQNAAYSQTITAGGGTGGYTFSLASGQLPGGLTLSSGGAISGTIDDQPGRFAFSVTATDSSGNSYTKPMALDVLGATPALTEITVGAVNNAGSLSASPSLGQYATGPNGEISLGEIDDAVLGDSYSASAGTCCGGVAPFTWTASGLPAGMSVRSGSGVTLPYVTPGDVEIWGVPQAAGNYTVQLTATDATGLSTTLSFPFHVSVLDRTPAAPNGTIGTPYSANLRVLGGAGPYTLTPEAGFVPDGISQTGALQIGGTPLENGVFNPLNLYTDSATPPNTLLRTDSFTIDNLSGPAITIDTDFKILAVAGKPFSQQLSACCVAAYTWSLAGGSLPTGLTLTSTGLLSGTTAAVGNYELLVEAADQANVAHPGFRQFQLIVHAIAITTASPLPAATQGVAYTQTLAATGGSGTLTWSVLDAGDGPYLPAGLTLSSSGVLSGTPTTAGQYSFIAVVTDTSGNSGRSQVTILIGPAGGLTTPTAALGTTAILVGSAAGTSSVVLSSDAGAWTAVSNSSFLHVSGGSASGEDSSLVVFTYDAFTGAGTRTGTLTIAGLTLTVTQVGTNYLAPGPVTTLVSTGLNGPGGPAVDSSGNVYFSDQGNNAVKEWDAATQQVTTLFSSGLSNPKAVAVDSLGNVYIVDAGDTAVKEWNATTHQVTTLVSSGLSSPIGVAVDASGNVYISDKGNDTIQEWNAATQQVTTLVSSGLSNPQLLAVDISGNVYFADNGNNTLKEWSAYSQQVTTLVSTGLNSPEGIAVDGSGNVYFTDDVNLTVGVWSAATHQVATLASGLNSPKGVAVDASGNVYFPDSGNNTLKGIPNAYVGPAAGLTEGSAAGSDALLPVVPLTQSLTGVYAPSSDQSWLTIGSISSGVVNFSFAANATGSPQVAHITVLGQQITVTQNAAATGTASQTISFNAPANVTYGVAPFSIAADASASSSLSVSFTSNTASICTTSGTNGNTVTILGGGVCSITASQSGNATYAAAAPVTQVFTVNPAAQTIAFGSLPSVALTAAPFAVSATASSGLAVTFSTTTTTVCTVSSPVVTIVALGSCAVTANQVGNADYSAAPPVTVTFAVTSNTFTAAAAAAGPGSAYVIPSAVCSYTTHCYLVPGASFSIPFTLNLTNAATVDSLTFGVQITPNASAPALTGTLGFTRNSAIVDSPLVSAGGTANSISVFWSSLTTPLGGSSPIGVVTGSVPANAVPGQTYTIAVTGASAALSSASVPVSPGPNATLTVGYPYLVGDVSPYTSDTAPNFGDGVLNILDLIQELFAVNSIPGFVPAACSDRLDGMDAYPADTATTRGGDGALDIRDLIIELFRVNNLDLNRPVRSSRGGCAASTSSSENSEASTQAARTAAPKPELPIEGALVLGPPESYSATQDRVPVYLEASGNLANVAVTFGLGDRHSQLYFLPSLLTPPSFAQDSQLGVVAAAWLDGLNVPAGNRLLLGYIAGPAAALPNLQVYGLSASGLNDNREVRLAPPAGPASQ